MIFTRIDRYHLFIRLNKDIATYEIINYTYAAQRETAKGLVQVFRVKQRSRLH